MAEESDPILLAPICPLAFDAVRTQKESLADIPSYQDIIMSFMGFFSARSKSSQQFSLPECLTFLFLYQ